MNKIYSDATSALAGVVQNGQTIAVGGFGIVACTFAIAAVTAACTSAGTSARSAC